MKGHPPDPVQALARAKMNAWKKAERVEFLTQFRKTSSGLQREFLLRSLAAEHSPGEMNAFARRIRLMTDRALAIACTASEAAHNGTKRSFEQLLRAEADPLYAFILNGQSLEAIQHDDDIHQPSVITAQSAPFQVFGAQRSYDLGSDEPPRTSRITRAVNGFEEKFCQAVRALGYQYRLETVGESGLSVDEAVDALVKAVSAGQPVPAMLGNLTGAAKRRVLFIQSWDADRGTALEMHDPHTGETVWVNDADLRGEKELPLSNKALRRLLEVALPSKR